jgi:hypothetical protein
VFVAIAQRCGRTRSNWQRLQDVCRYLTLWPAPGTEDRSSDTTVAARSRSADPVVRLLSGPRGAAGRECAVASRALNIDKIGNADPAACALLLGAISPKSGARGPAIGHQCLYGHRSAVTHAKRNSRQLLAEGAGFEPARRFITVYTLSRRAPSTARPPLPVPAETNGAPAAAQ